MTPSGRLPRRRVHEPEWRSAAAAWVRHELASPGDRMIRVIDVRRVGPRDAWVAVEVGGQRVVVGLRREGIGRDGWFTVLYLCHDQTADHATAATTAEASGVGGEGAPAPPVAPVDHRAS